MAECQANYSVYGARKLWFAARRAGHDIDRDRISGPVRPLEIGGVSQTKMVHATRLDLHVARPGDVRGDRVVGAYAR